MNKTANKILSLVLTLAMVFAVNTPVLAAPDDEGATLGQSGLITEFEPIGEEFTPQAVAVGTPLEKLIFPDSLGATLLPSGEDAAAAATDIAVSEWECTTDGGYAPEADGKLFTFAPKLALPDGVALSEGVTAPRIYVTVGVVSVAPMSLASYTLTLASDGTRFTKGDGSGAEAFSAEGFSYDDATSTLTLTNFTFTTDAAKAMEINKPITIALAGNSSITGGNAVSGAAYGVDSYPNLTFKGDGTLVASAGKCAATSYGIISSSSITMTESSKISGVGAADSSSSYGVYVNGKLIVADNTSVTGTAGNANTYSYGVFARGALNMTGGSITGTGGNASTSRGVYFGADSNTMSGGTITAQSGNGAKSSAIFSSNDIAGVIVQGGAAEGDRNKLMHSSDGYRIDGGAVAKHAVMTTPSSTTYALTVNSGSGDGNYVAGATVTITADPAPSGKVFERWRGGDGGTFADASNASTTFTMPANAATVTAIYKDSGSTPTNYTISVSASPSNGGSVSGGGTFAKDSSRTVTAIPNSGYLFKNWTENGTEVSADASHTFNLTGDRSLIANFIAGNVDVEVKPQGNAPATTLPDKSAVEDAVLTTQDLADIQNNGAAFTITLEVKEATPPAADQQAVEDSLQGHTLGMYLDISLFKQKDNGTPEAVTQLSKAIQIRFAVPAELAKSGRTFSVIRVHNGVLKILPNLSTDPNYILVETDRFSTYALAYADATTPPPVQPPVSKPVGRPNNSGSSSGGSSGSGTTTAVRTTTPSNWSEAAQIQSLIDKSTESYIRTNSTETYGLRKDAWPKLKGFQYQHDTREDKSVLVRLYIPAPEKMAVDTYVTGWVKGKTVDSRKAFFEKWFNNQVRVIHMDNPNSWGQEVQIAAKVDLAGMDSKRLYFYSYNKKTNSYTLIEKPRYWIDENGYLHFYTELAGDIIISEGPLEKK